MSTVKWVLGAAVLMAVVVVDRRLREQAMARARLAYVRDIDTQWREAEPPHVVAQSRAALRLLDPYVPDKGHLAP